MTEKTTTTDFSRFPELWLYFSYKYKDLTQRFNTLTGGAPKHEHPPTHTHTNPSINRHGSYHQ